MITGSETAHLAARVGPLFLEGRLPVVPAKDAVALGLREDQVVRMVAEVRNEQVKLILQGRLFDPPPQANIKAGETVAMKVQILPNGNATLRPIEIYPAPPNAPKPVGVGPPVNPSPAITVQITAREAGQLNLQSGAIVRPGIVVQGGQLKLALQGKMFDAPAQLKVSQGDSLPFRVQVLPSGAAVLTPMDPIVRGTVPETKVPAPATTGDGRPPVTASTTPAASTSSVAGSSARVSGLVAQDVLASLNVSRAPEPSVARTSFSATPPQVTLPAITPQQIAPLQNVQLQATPQQTVPLQSTPLQALQSQVISPSAASQVMPQQIAPSQTAPLQATPMQVTPSSVTPQQITSSQNVQLQATPQQTVPPQNTPLQALQLQVTSPSAASQVMPQQIAPFQTAPLQVAPTQVTPTQVTPTQVTPTQVTTIPVTPQQTAPLQNPPLQSPPLQAAPLINTAKQADSGLSGSLPSSFPRIDRLALHPPGSEALIAALRPSGLEQLLPMAALASPEISKLLQYIFRMRPAMDQMSAQDVRQSIQQSGFFTESMLAKGLGQQAIDLKSILRMLVQRLQGQHQEAAAKISRAVDDLESLQIKALESSLPREQGLHAMLAFANAPPIDIRINRESVKQDEQERAWVVNLYSQSDEWGELWLRTRVFSEGKIEVAMWAAREDIFISAQERVGQLRETITQAGLELKDLQLFYGRRPAAATDISPTGAAEHIDLEA